MSDREDYFENARSWADTQSGAVLRERKIAWIIAGIATSVAVILAITLLILLPLKSVEPYVVTVDRQNGAVQVASGIEPGKLSQNDSVIQAELARYVRARESFDSTDLARMYRQVQLMSSRDVSSSYVRFMSAKNPASPLNALDRGDTLTVTIKSVSLIAPGSAMVRFDVSRTAPGGGTISASGSFVSAISFGFSGRPLRAADRFDNPLGFQVTRYRRDVEGFAT
jgi:type IV secretion system protein VirB8